MTRTVAVCTDVVLLVSVWSGGLDLQGPLFLQEPPHRVEFSNISGARVDCTAHGSPSPEVEWVLVDGSPVHQVRPNSSALCHYLIKPFLANFLPPPDQNAVINDPAGLSNAILLQRIVWIRFTNRN